MALNWRDSVSCIHGNVGFISELREVKYNTSNPLYLHYFLTVVPMTVLKPTNGSFINPQNIQSRCQTITEEQQRAQIQHQLKLIFFQTKSVEFMWRRQMTK